MFTRLVLPASVIEEIENVVLAHVARQRCRGRVLGPQLLRPVDEALIDVLAINGKRLPDCEVRHVLYHAQKAWSAASQVHEDIMGPELEAYLQREVDRCDAIDKVSRPLSAQEVKVALFEEEAVSSDWYGKDGKNVTLRRRAFVDENRGRINSLIGRLDSQDATHARREGQRESGPGFQRST